MSDEIVRRPFSGLRQFTGARIALGRTGDSLPTTDLLDFSVARALARDAVHAELDVVGLTRQLQACGIDPIRVHSAAANRGIYLRRPDLGRKLDQVSREMLLASRPAVPPKSVFVIADGLSALAPSRYALPVIEALREQAGDELPGPVVLAEQARVALGDEIGEALGAEIAVVLIGERPGLSAPDSLGIYFTYAPRVSRTDAERNCISNVRLEGLSPERAARTLLYLWSESHRLQRSGVDLKDRSEEQESLLPPHESSPLRKQIKSTGFLTGG